MKRLLFFDLFLGAACLLAPTSTLAQGASLDTRALREDYRRLQSQLADLLEAHNALKIELSKLLNEVRQLRTKTATKDPAAVTRAALETLAKSVREIDRKRIQDKDLILKEMPALLRSTPTGAKPPTARRDWRSGRRSWRSGVRRARQSRQILISNNF